jgi:hypothetical protein
MTSVALQLDIKDEETYAKRKPCLDISLPYDSIHTMHYLKGTLPSFPRLLKHNSMKLCETNIARRASNRHIISIYKINHFISLKICIQRMKKACICFTN